MDVDVVEGVQIFPNFIRDLDDEVLGKGQPFSFGTLVVNFLGAFDDFSDDGVVDGGKPIFEVVVPNAGEVVVRGVDFNRPDEVGEPGCDGPNCGWEGGGVAIGAGEEFVILDGIFVAIASGFREVTPNEERSR